MNIRNEMWRSKLIASKLNLELRSKTPQKIQKGNEREFCIELAAFKCANPDICSDKICR